MKITLGDLCLPNAGQVKLEPDTLIDYFDISSVDNISKTVKGYETYSFEEAPSRARKAVRKNSILVSTVRPNLNAVAVFQTETDNTPVVSTGFCVLDCKENVNPRFVFNFCRSKAFIEDLVSQATGASYPAVSDKIVRAAKVPQYSSEKQNEIAQVLDSVSSIIEARKQELQKLDELVKARFVETFGDPIINSKHLHTKDLKDVLIMKAGDFTAASDISDTQSETNPFPCYGGNGIRGYVAEYNQEGDYSLVGRQGALSGNVQYARGKFKNTEHALLVTPIVEMNSIWLNQLLLNLDLKRYQTGAAQPGLSVKNLQEIPILCVPMDEQNKFAEFVKQLDKSKFVVQKALDEAQLLFDSLMQEYFG